MFFGTCFAGQSAHPRLCCRTLFITLSSLVLVLATLTTTADGVIVNGNNDVEFTGRDFTDTLRLDGMAGPGTRSFVAVGSRFQRIEIPQVDSMTFTATDCVFTDQIHHSAGATNSRYVFRNVTFTTAGYMLVMSATDGITIDFINCTVDVGVAAAYFLVVGGNAIRTSVHVRSSTVGKRLNFQGTSVDVLVNYTDSRLAGNLMNSFSGSCMDVQILVTDVELVMDVNSNGFVHASQDVRDTLVTFTRVSATVTHSQHFFLFNNGLQTSSIVVRDSNFTINFATPPTFLYFRLSSNTNVTLERTNIEFTSPNPTQNACYSNIGTDTSLRMVYRGSSCNGRFLFGTMSSSTFVIEENSVLSVGDLYFKAISGGSNIVFRDSQLLRLESSSNTPHVFFSAIVTGSDITFERTVIRSTYTGGSGNSLVYIKGLSAYGRFNMIDTQMELRTTRSSVYAFYHEVSPVIANEFSFVRISISMTCSSSCRTFLSMGAIQSVQPFRITQSTLSIDGMDGDLIFLDDLRNTLAVFDDLTLSMNLRGSTGSMMMRVAKALNINASIAMHNCNGTFTGSPSFRFASFLNANTQAKYISIMNNSVTMAPSGGTQMRFFSIDGSTLGADVHVSHNRIAFLSTIVSQAYIIYAVGSWSGSRLFYTNNNITGPSTIMPIGTAVTGIVQLTVRCNTYDGVMSVQLGATAPNSVAQAVPCGICNATVDCSAERTTGLESIRTYDNGTCGCTCRPGFSDEPIALNTVGWHAQCNRWESYAAAEATTTAAPTTTTTTTTTIAPTTTTTTATTGSITPPPIVRVTTSPAPNESTTTTPTTTPDPTTGDNATNTTDAPTPSSSNATTNTTSDPTNDANTTTTTTESPTTTDSPPPPPPPPANETRAAPAATALPEAVRQSGQGAVVVTTLGGGAAGAAPGWSAHASRSALFAQLAGCPQPLDGEDELETVTNPTQLALGEEPTRQYVGALVANTAIVAGMMLLQAVVGLVLFAAGFGRNAEGALVAAAAAEPAEPDGDGDGGEREASGSSGFGVRLAACMLKAKLPRANYIWFLLFVQPVTQCSLVLASQSRGRPVHFVAGVVAFLVSQGLGLLMLLQITGRELRAVYVLRPWAAPADAPELAELPPGVNPDERDLDFDVRPTNPVVNLFTPRGDWFAEDSADASAQLRHAMFKPLYGPMRRGGRLFIAADLALALVFGFAAAVFPETRWECRVQMGIILAAMLLYLGAVVVVRPFTVPVDNVLLFVLATLEAAAAATLLVAVTTEDEATAVSAQKVSEGISSATTWVTFGIMLKDCCVAVGRAYIKKRHAAERERRKRAAGDEREPYGSAAAANPVAAAWGAADADAGAAEPDADAVERVAAALEAAPELWADAGDGRHVRLCVAWVDADDDGSGGGWWGAMPADEDADAAQVWYDGEGGAYWDGVSGLWHDAVSGAWWGDGVEGGEEGDGSASEPSTVAR